MVVKIKHNHYLIKLQIENQNEFTIYDLAKKCRSKKELYNLLIRDGSIYLPPIQDSKQKFLRSLMFGDKDYIKWDNVRVTKIPQYKGLRVKDILLFAKPKIDIERYLPDYEYSKEPNREWLCNLVNSLFHYDFTYFVDARVQQRRIKMLQNQNMCITAKKELVEFFKSSKSLSLEKGKSFFLARASKENKYFANIDKMEEKKRNEDDQLQLKLRGKIDSQNSKIKEFEAKQSKATGLWWLYWENVKTVWIGNDRWRR